MKRLVYILFIVSIVLVICFGVTVFADWQTYYEYYSSPFYLYVLERALQFLLPAAIFTVVAFIYKKKNKKHK